MAQTDNQEFFKSDVINNLKNVDSHDELKNIVGNLGAGELKRNLLAEIHSIKANRKRCSEPGQNDFLIVDTVWYYYNQLWGIVVKLEAVLFNDQNLIAKLQEIRQFKEQFTIDLLGLADYIVTFDTATSTFMEIAQPLLAKLSDLDLNEILSNILNYKSGEVPKKCTALQYLLDDLNRYDIEFVDMVNMQGENRSELIKALSPLFSEMLELQLRALIKKTRKEAPDVSKFVKKLSLILSNKLRTVNAVLNYQLDPIDEENKMDMRKSERNEGKLALEATKLQGYTSPKKFRKESVQSGGYDKKYDPYYFTNKEVRNKV